MGKRRGWRDERERQADGKGDEAPHLGLRWSSQTISPPTRSAAAKIGTTTSPSPLAAVWPPAPALGGGTGDAGIGLSVGDAGAEGESEGGVVGEADGDGEGLGAAMTVKE